MCCSSVHWLHGNHVPGEADDLHQSDGDECEVHLPPTVALRACTRARMVVVVPAFAVGQQRHYEVISTLVRCVVVSVSPAVASGVH